MSSANYKSICPVKINNYSAPENPKVEVRAATYSILKEAEALIQKAFPELVTQVQFHLKTDGFWYSLKVQCKTVDEMVEVADLVHIVQALSRRLQEAPPPRPVDKECGPFSPNLGDPLTDYSPSFDLSPHCLSSNNGTDEEVDEEFFECTMEG